MPTNINEIELKIGLSDADKAAMQAAITALVKANLITAYSSSATYALGDFVYYDGKFYKCTTAISTAEAWTSAHWSEATLNDVIDKVNQAANSVENKLSKGDYDATTGVGYADNADNLIATKGLTVNDDPMSYGIVGGAQKSAVGDGNASLNKLVCVDVVRNQLILDSVLADGTGWTGSSSTTYSFNDNVLTFNAGYYGWMRYSVFAPNGHIFLLRVLIKTTSATDKIAIGFDDGGTVDCSSATEKQYVYGVIASNASSNYIKFTDKRSSGNDAVSVYEIKLIDLTQAFGSNEVVNAIIGTTASMQVANLLKSFPQIFIWTDYDTGTMVPSKTAKLLPVGVNQWDEDASFTGINTMTGQPSSFTDRLTSKNFIRVTPNTKYYISRINFYVLEYDINENFIGRTKFDVTNYSYSQPDACIFTTSSNCYYIKFANTGVDSETTYNDDICINVSDPNINGKYYPSKRNPVTLPNYEGHGILKVVDGKVVADGTELYPDGNSKKRYLIANLGECYWQLNSGIFNTASIPNVFQTNNILNTMGYTPRSWSGVNSYDLSIHFDENGRVYIHDERYATVEALVSALNNQFVTYPLATEEDITTPVFQSTFPVEQGGTLQFLDEDDNPIAGLQGSEIFYQKNIKAFVEALGEATNWDPERIKRLGNLSFTPEYVDITLNPSPTGAYARAQVYNATFTIVISAALTGTANGSITFQDSEVDLTNFQTKPAEAIYDMDGKKVSEAPTTADCNIASFVGRSKSGTVMWSLLHSGVNKVKIHIEEAVPLDSSGNGKIDCRASLIL